MEINIDKLKEEMRQLAKANFNADVEAEHAYKLFTSQEFDDVLKGHTYGKFINAGGSGLVFEINDISTKKPRALKLSRAERPEIGRAQDKVVNVELEMEALAMVGHQHVTRFYGGKKTASGHYMIVTQYVNKPQSLDEWVISRILSPTQTEKHSRSTSVSEIAQHLIALGQKLHTCAAALQFMHEQYELYHMDVKAANLLVSENGATFIADLGFARWKGRYQSPDEEIHVGYTFGPHHPFLLRKNSGIPDTAGRAYTILTPNELGPRYDIYAFGKTILHLLRLFKNRFGDRVLGCYEFLYLHLLASMMLDGHNVLGGTDESSAYIDDVAFGITGDLLKTFKFDHMSQVTDRLARFVGKSCIEFNIQELHPWYRRSINHGVGYLNLTPRVAAILNHPALRRLKDVKQLGNVDEVYPNATHSRLAHIEGVTGLIIQCLLALYHDPHNPLFKVLASEDDFKELILAALLHDLGQSDYGHDLEEVNSILSHSRIAQNIASRNSFVDSKGRNLMQLITGENEDEWGLGYDNINWVWDSKREPARFAFFKDLLNGPLDADKLDYLIRDSKATNVRHADGIDNQRLLRCLTIIPVNKEGDILLRLGIKQKGLSTGEMVSIARQKMYHSVYFHHAARSLKSMVRYSVSCGLEKLRSELLLKGELESDLIVLEMFCSYLVHQMPEFGQLGKGTVGVSESAKKKANDLWKKSWSIIAEKGVGIDKSLTFFTPYCSDSELDLLRAASARLGYKILWERSFSSFRDGSIGHTKEKFKWPGCRKSMEELANLLLEKACSRVASKTASAESQNETGHAEKIRHDLSGKVLLIADAPLRDVTAGGALPPVLKDIDRKRGAYMAKEASPHGGTFLWREGIEKMMNEACFFRVFCQPDFYDALLSILSQKEINSQIQSYLGIGNDE